MPKVKSDMPENVAVETEVGVDAGVDAMDYSELLKDLIGQVIEIAPEDLVVPQRLNVRLHKGNPEDDAAKLEELAQSIKDVGQLQASGAYPTMDAETGEISYVLFFGNRRRDAVALNNSRLKAGKAPYKLQVKVFTEGDAKKMRQAALHENIKRKDFVPMDFALNIDEVRKENGWESGKDTKQVAKYFGCSAAQITQYEKLLTLSEADQLKISDLGVAGSPAKYLAHKVDPDQQSEVLDAATAAATAEAGSATPVAPQKQHIEAAAEAADARRGGPEPVNRKGLLEFFQAIADSPAYGYSNSPARSYAAYFVDKFATGIGKSKSCLEKFDTMIMNEEGELYGGIGTPSKLEAAEAEAERIKAEEAEKKRKEKEKAKVKK